MFVFTALFLSLTVFAATPVAESTNTYYLETVPKHELRMEVEYRHCKDDPLPLSFRRTNSLTSVQGKKVRFIVLKSDPRDTKCKGALKKSNLKYVVESSPDDHTQTYVILNKNEKLLSAESVKPSK
jgi:hypothetical protein